MKIICAPENFDFDQHTADLSVVLYGSTTDPKKGAIGSGIPGAVRKALLTVEPLAWDLVSLALSVFAADLAGHRARSPDGWTRTFDLHVAVSSPEVWTTCKQSVEDLLRFLTTDLWCVSFIAGGMVPENHSKAAPLDVDAAVLLSGGLDSLIGSIDQGHGSRRLIAVSQIVRGDGEKQEVFAAAINGIKQHLRLSHAEHLPNIESPASQRSRSLLFLSYGVLAATALKKYQQGQQADLFVCENGFIALNPPLTLGRVGSLSTRTTHPVVFGHLRTILAKLNLRVNVTNPYAAMTKGEMLSGCKDQPLLESLATQSTSCSRFKQYGYKHCGRCVPCLVRRASFEQWKGVDRTVYRYEALGRDDPDYAGFDDVRSALMAIMESKRLGVKRWLGATLSSRLIDNKDALRGVAQRGLDEMGVLLAKLKVR
jgi:hypothetical protein